MTLRAFTTSVHSPISGSTCRRKIAVQISAGTREVTVVEAWMVAEDTAGKVRTDIVEEKSESGMCGTSIIKAYIDDLCVANI
jgi:hypothetical protein